MPVSVSPTVDRLLDIAYHEQGVTGTGQHIFEEFPDNGPLQLARILKLIHQHMFVPDTGFLQDKVGIAFA